MPEQVGADPCRTLNTRSSNGLTHDECHGGGDLERTKRGANGQEQTLMWRRWTRPLQVVPYRISCVLRQRQPGLAPPLPITRMSPRFQSRSDLRSSTISRALNPRRASSKSTARFRIPIRVHVSGAETTCSTASGDICRGSSVRVQLANLGTASTISGEQDPSATRNRRNVRSALPATFA
jgi:hypothetical protein